ncbi:MAG TPA: putative N-acetylmannosamine-6-phosphate 2-epimerase [Verrucomicrobiae bacterium]|nr:putative N-acetylmannosamine-6-phosphate 2-epimerase [Verrucomicrobiae bacterium]
MTPAQASLLERLRGGLIVSVQAWPGSAIDDPAVIAAMALAAQENGAVALRIQGAANLRAVRARVTVPTIGLIKREYAGFEPYITPTPDEVEAVAASGAEIVAFDATPRARPGGAGPSGLVAAVHACGRLAMADCATVEDGRAALAAGAEILATTLCGYTPQTRGTPLPALRLAGELARLHAPLVVCEGGIVRPTQVGEALASGAGAVVVGSAITNVDWLVREFAGSLACKPKP